MHSQHTISKVAAVCLLVACMSATLLAGIIVAGIFTPYRSNPGVGSGLGAVTAVAGSGFIVSCAVDRVMRRLDEIEAVASSRRVTYLPMSPKARHMAVGETPQVGLTPEAIAAARALAQRIADANGR